MSSYLNLYVKLKNEEREPILLFSYTRSSEVYQYFNDELHPVFMGMDEVKYEELTYDKVGLVIDAIKSDIKKIDKRVTQLEKHADGNREIIDEILSDLEYREQLQDALNDCIFIRALVYETTLGYIKYTLVCNIG